MSEQRNALSEGNGMHRRRWCKEEKTLARSADFRPSVADFALALVRRDARLAAFVLPAKFFFLGLFAVVDFWKSISHYGQITAADRQKQRANYSNLQLRPSTTVIYYTLLPDQGPLLSS